MEKDELHGDRNDRPHGRSRISDPQCLAALEQMDDDKLDWTRQVFPSAEKLASLRSDIAALVERLERTPLLLLPCDAVRLKGAAFVSKDGKAKWRLVQVALSGDQLQCSRPYHVRPNRTPAFFLR